MRWKGGIRSIILESYISKSFLLPLAPMLAQHEVVSACKPFPFNNFTYFFTLFSKCFSSFHHCTCSLSVSRQYLALDGIYHPLRAAFPNNSTLWWPEKIEQTTSLRGYHPPWRHFPMDLRMFGLTEATFKLQFPGDFKFELLPLHSPLLRQSLLVSFPPLIDMLKFSG